MRTIRQDLLTLLIGLFIFSGCKNSNEVGLEVDPSRQVELAITDTLSIRTVTVREDSSITSGISQHPFGYLQDTELGSTTSELAMALSLRNTSVSFGPTTVLDSAVLVLKYGTEFYGDSVNSVYQVDVHELLDSYDFAKSYSNNKTWSSGNLLGSVTVPRFNIRKNVPVKVHRIGRNDTVIYRGPHLRIPLDPDFIKTRFIDAPAETYTTTANFTSYFKGLYLKLNKAQSTGKGGLVLFNLLADSVGISIYYRNVGTTIDTLVTNFNASSTGTAASISHEFTSAVQAQLDNPSQEFSTVYAQPMSGLRTRLAFPHIDKLKALGNIVINKAELVVQSLTSSLDPAPRLTLYRTDIAGQRQPVPDNNIGQRSGTPGDGRALAEFNFGGFYDKTNKRYVFTVTSYIQDLLDGKMTQYNTYLAPLSIYNNRSSVSDFNPASNTVYRSILGGGNNTQYKMKLNIIYTKVK